MGTLRIADRRQDCAWARLEVSSLFLEFYGSRGLGRKRFGASGVGSWRSLWLGLKGLPCSIHLGYMGFPKIRGTYYNGESNGKENGK